MADGAKQIEDEILNEQNARQAKLDSSTQRVDTNKVSLTGGPSYDQDIYGGGGGYDTSIEVGRRAGEDDRMHEDDDEPVRLLDSYTAPKQFLQELAEDAEDAEDPLLANLKAKQIQSRQSDYHNRRFDRDSSGTVVSDPFSSSAEGNDQSEGGYKEAMRRAELEREEARVMKKIKEQQEEASNQMDVDRPERSKTPTPEELAATASTGRKKTTLGPEGTSESTLSTGEWSASETVPPPKKTRSRWDQTPAATPMGASADGATPRRSRWDQTPVAVNGAATPMGQFGQTPLISNSHTTSGICTNTYTCSKTMQTPVGSSNGFTMQDDSSGGGLMGLMPELPTEIEGVGQFLSGEQDESNLTLEELKERKIMRLLLKIKKRCPPMRKTALRQITDKAREFGAGPLFDKILPLLMERTLEDQERHLLVKVIDRVLYSWMTLFYFCAWYTISTSLSQAVCKSKKSWQARHTGIKIVQQIAIMMGLESISHAASPYGIESFDSVLKPLWTGIRKHRGKGLAAFLKAIVSNRVSRPVRRQTDLCTKSGQVILIREFQSPDEEMKKIVLKVVKQCSATDGVEILPQFFANFWVRRMALDRRNYRQVVETTVELANKAGVTEIVSRIVNDLKDESEPYRKMVISALGANEIDERLEVQLIDGIIYAFQEQTVEDIVMLEGFGTVVHALGIRVKPYLTQIVSTILWRLNNKSAKVRQQAADLTSKLAVVMKQCGEDQLLSKLGVVLFEQLGEEYPDTLGSIIAAEASIANVVGMTQMSPPVKDLLPRMTPILRNRHEKVQEASINLIGRIADRGAEFVSAREWMRICFELLDLLKAHKKAIRRAAAIGPQDVLSVLLTNLKVQERQSRVCSTVAIAIVAETCGPFTCIPAILNEYRTPELNVRNGCLKSL
ncbi:splicing factor 3B subunit 1, partial [Melampsora americana]